MLKLDKDKVIKDPEDTSEQEEVKDSDKSIKDEPGGEDEAKTVQGDAKAQGAKGD